MQIISQRMREVQHAEWKTIKTFLSTSAVELGRNSCQSQKSETMSILSRRQQWKRERQTTSETLVQRRVTPQQNIYPAELMIAIVWNGNGKVKPFKFINVLIIHFRNHQGDDLFVLSRVARLGKSMSLLPLEFTIVCRTAWSPWRWYLSG